MPAGTRIRNSSDTARPVIFSKNFCGTESTACPPEGRETRYFTGSNGGRQDIDFLEGMTYFEKWKRQTFYGRHETMKSSHNHFTGEGER